MGCLKSRGYTLIELMVVVAIIAVLSTGCVISRSAYKNYMNAVNVKYTKDSILIFVTNAKQYCREKQEIGCIAYDTEQKKIKFSSDNKLICSFQFTDGLSLYGINTPDGKIQVDDKGFTTDACTIKFTDGKGALHSITMCVGTAYVDIKE